MGRMPIFHRNPLTIEPCDSWFYGGLIQISLGYTPVEGRLHTCYAPVRRSSAESKLSLLPLDLHVLGLPLAFILSQDQTLHCKSLKIDSQSKLTLVGLSHHFKELLSEQCPSALNVYPKTGRQRYFTFQSVQASLSFFFLLLVACSGALRSKRGQM